MDKTKLAVCIEDEEYETRFVKCVLNHYKESYEIHIVENIQEIAEEEKEKCYVIVTEEDTELDLLDGKKAAVLVLQEQEDKNALVSNEKVFYTEKYQEVYKIMEKLEQIVTQKFSQNLHRGVITNGQVIGVFSLEQEEMQIPFSALLAEIIGEKHRVLLIDMQPFSGFSVELDKEEYTLGMEDLITIAITGLYTNNRLMASIGHEQKWDFVYPVRNTQCLSETDGEIYQKIIQILQQEYGYEQIILNFGAMFSGIGRLMSSCQQFYILTKRKEECSWREEAFVQEMKSHGKEEFLQRVIWIEVPMHFVKEKSWKQLAKTWLWSELGDKLRELNWMENGNGVYM